MQVFDIREYGAVSDGQTDNATAIQRAIDACTAARGGIVQVPAGLEFMTGPFDLKSFVTLHLEAGSRIYANPDEMVYTKSAFRKNLGEGSIWIGGENAGDVTISGPGVIDGNGIAFMGPEEKAAYVLKDFHVFDRRPHVLTLVNIHNLRIREVTLRNSAYWCVHLIGCVDVDIQRVRIENHLKIRNSDGIDLDHTRNVRIDHCYIESGDDCICFKTRREYEEYGPTENVLVTNCTMISTSCSVKLGSENMDAIRNIAVRDCSIRSSNRGIGIQNRDEGVVENVVFKNITVEGRLFDDVWWGKAEPIYVTAYKRKASTHKDANVRFAPGQTVGKVGLVQGITFENITCMSENGIFIGGEEGKVRNIRLDGVKVTLEKTTSFPGGVYDLRPSDTTGLLEAPTCGIYLQEAAQVFLHNSTVEWGPHTVPNFDAALHAERVQGLTIEGFTGTGARPGADAMRFEQCSNVIRK
jgi:polygalacturonase